MMDRIFGFYERSFPARLRWLLRGVVHDRETLRQVIAYVLIGLIALVIDFGTFQLMLVSHVFLAGAVTIGFAASVVVHFTLNRNFNFRSFDRTIGQQARTYGVVLVVVWLLSIACVEVGVGILGLSPLLAKLLSVPVIVPVSFLGHRHLTFGPGIIETLRRLRASRSKG